MKLRRSSARPVTMYDRKMACKAHVEYALAPMLEPRSRPIHTREDYTLWVERVCATVHAAANGWSDANDGCPVTLDDVRRCDQSASGHIDYQHKFALRVAEIAVYGRRL